MSAADYQVTRSPTDAADLRTRRAWRGAAALGELANVSIGGQGVTRVWKMSHKFGDLFHLKKVLNKYLLEMISTIFG